MGINELLIVGIVFCIIQIINIKWIKSELNLK